MFLLVHIKDRSTFEFMNGTTKFDIVDKYKYLGVILDEHLYFNTIASFMAGSGR